ncbi:hypothetical protein CHARACLAT_032882 [Characodon lateralis]|uniref:Uncharacterized protein n=1 Tax=Characodon lateralis TaxID=208331 RepID=A0ABU7EZ95_9TELE|nr:hypothetical protein [Characodon lateralis]
MKSLITVQSSNPKTSLSRSRKPESSCFIQKVSLHRWTQRGPVHTHAQVQHGSRSWPVFLSKLNRVNISPNDSLPVRQSNRSRSSRVSPVLSMRIIPSPHRAVLPQQLS